MIAERRSGRVGLTQVLAVAVAATAGAAWSQGHRVHHPGGNGPGTGRHIVLVAGDEEYRSEEALPMLARILSRHHGFETTVLFALDAETGIIDPDEQTNIPGLEVLGEADMLVLFTRFRELPDESMRYVDEYVHSGRPILGIRTATHAFFYRRNKQSRYADYSWDAEGQWPGGFGRAVLGDTWIRHHGKHGEQSTRGVVDPEHAEHPILRGVQDVWGPTDVYGLDHLGADAEVLLRGQVLDGMTPGAPAATGSQNDPMVPIVWTRAFQGREGKTSRVVTSTIGAAVDLENEGLRRLFVNAVYWGVGLEERIPERARVDLVGDYEPSSFGFGGARKGRRPEDYQ